MSSSLRKVATGGSEDVPRRPLIRERPGRHCSAEWTRYRFSPTHSGARAGTREPPTRRRRPSLSRSPLLAPPLVLRRPAGDHLRGPARPAGQEEPPSARLEIGRRSTGCLPRGTGTLTIRQHDDPAPDPGPFPPHGVFTPSTPPFSHPCSTTFSLMLKNSSARMYVATPRPAVRPPPRHTPSAPTCDIVVTAGCIPRTQRNGCNHATSLTTRRDMPE